MTAPPSAPPPDNLLVGTVVAGRFTLEALTGYGGMGAVYRALDALTGKRVALKLLHAVTSPEQAYRFRREAVLLAELRHPGIVAYVAHGSTPDGQSFLAMDWLEGVDLARRLASKPLSLPETLALLRRAAEALATAHGQGIVHRDLKPSNLFLRAGRPEEAVLLDFGLARYVESTLVGVTRNHAVVGTPGYMAPEQASGEPDILPSADIFSLGCVLYECLTGQPPFSGRNFAAVLDKILNAPPAPLHTLRADLPSGLQVLIDRMLDKDPKRRLPDASSLLSSLAALESVPGLLLPEAPSEAPPAPAASTAPRLVSLLRLGFPAAPSGEAGTAPLWGPAPREELRQALAPHIAWVEALADGSLVAPLTLERGTATDQTELAVRCALALQERWPEATVALATGVCAFHEHLPVGEAMERAGGLLRPNERGAASSPPMVLDEVTAGLLGPGFLLSRASAGSFHLLGARPGADEPRPLLGRSTPCVGRDQELAFLELTLTACAEESAARALLVTAPAGLGKSRLRHEFLRRLERFGQPMLVLRGRGDPMHASLPFGPVAQAVRRMCGVVEGEPLATRRQKLAQRVTRYLLPEQMQDTTEFLGELCAIPFPADDSPLLRAAREDSRLMSAQITRAVVALLRSESSQGLVLLVLEDLHWSDAPTVKLVDEVLRELAESPLLVLALARPEVKEQFPGLWARCLQEMPLRGLSPRASARLVQEVLGFQVADVVVSRLVEQAAGNALFLEELLRGVAEGRGEETPGTVLAMLQSRLQRLEPGPLRTLLAASSFGRTFWGGGVKALLGEQGEGLEEHLRRLVEQELIEPQPESRLPGETEYRFRHALLRDAASTLVPEAQRGADQQGARVWQEQRGGARVA